MGLPVGSDAATISCQGPLPDPPSTGVPRRTRDPTAVADGVTVTVVDPDFVGSWVEVAVMVAAPEAVGVKMPEELAAPSVAVQVTVELNAPFPDKAAEQVLVCAVVIIVGELVTETELIVEATINVTVAEPDSPGFSVDVAVMVSDPEAGTLAGAVYSPMPEIVPETADQVRAEL